MSWGECRHDPAYVLIDFFWSNKMTRFHKIAVAAAAALAAQVALANPFPPNAVPEPGVLGLVGVALVAAIYFGKRRK